MKALQKKNVILTTDNGKIEKTGGAYFLIAPSHIGLCKINVCKIVRKDTVVFGTKEFRVHQLPDPIALIGGRSGGTIKKDQLIAMGGLIAKVNCCGFDLPISIIEFTLISTRDSTATGISRNTGPQYNQKSMTLLNQLQPNDHLLVCNISAKMPLQVRLVPPAEFVIEE